MLGTAVVPHPDAAFAPAIAHGKARALHPAGQEGQQIVALFHAHLDNTAGEMLVHIQRLAAWARFSIRQNTDHRVDRHLIGPAVGVGIVQGCQAIAHFLHRRRQGVIGCAQIAPHGIAAGFGALPHVQDGHQGGLFHERQVCVPFIRNAALAGRQLENLRVLLGIPFRQIGVAFQWSERTAQGHMVFHAQVLIREEKHHMLSQQAFDFGNIAVICLGQIDAMHLRPQRTRQALYLPTVPHCIRSHGVPIPWKIVP